MRIRSLVAACLCGSPIVLGQASVAANPYDVKDAYKIYSVLLPLEESYGFAKGTVVIQGETVPEQVASQPCVTREAAIRFKEAIANYHRVNRDQKLLKRQFQIEKPYEVVNSDTIQALFKEGGWESFYKRHPDSGGYITMSAVGLNKGKTRAIVYTGSSCGGLCGSWRFHLLEKIDGNWKEVPGVSCFAVSQEFQFPWDLARALLLPYRAIAISTISPIKSE
jgi:hypothetical protein